MSEERQAYIEKVRETESWLIDRLLYAVQFYVYADADRKDVSEMLESLTEGDSWDEQVAALVRVPKWISRNEAQEIIDRHFATRPPPSLRREPIEADREAMEEWRCFHCGDVFKDRRSARLHFGRDEQSEAACVIKAGAEGSLLKALRDAEEQADDAIQQMHNESTDAALAFHQQRCRHNQALIAAEESGYEKGLADGRAFSTPAASDAEAMARALKAAHEALSRANVTAYLDMPEDTADVVARAVIAALLLPKAGEMETETVFEVWEDDLMVASASASTEAEGLHYFAVYSQDGPVKLVRAETVRQVIATEGRKGEDQADG